MDPAELANLELPGGRRVGEVLSASVIARPNGTGKKARKNRQGGGESQAPGRCWLARAVDSLDITRVEALLALPGTRVDQHGPGQDTALLGVARQLGWAAERTGLPVGDAETSQWIRNRRLAILDALLARGADAMLAGRDNRTAIELMGRDTEALRRVARLGQHVGYIAARGLCAALEAGDSAAATYWLGKQKGQDCWPNPVAAAMKALAPHDAIVRGTRMKRAQALHWLRRLRRAGFSLDRALEPPPAVAEGDAYSIDDTQDTPLVRAARWQDVQVMKVLIEEGADPHAWAPNGRHPFMAWVRNRELGADPTNVHTMMEFASLFSCPGMMASPKLQQNPKCGWPAYRETHPLGAILSGPCKSTSEPLCRLGWQMAHDLIAQGLACPLPDGGTPSCVEKILGWFLYQFRWQAHGSEATQAVENAACRELVRFMRALPGWREAQAVPCEDINRFQAELIVTLAEQGAYPDRIMEQLAQEGMAWGSSAGTINDILNRSNLRPLPYLCALMGQRAMAHPEDKPLNPQAIGFLVGRDDTPQEDKDLAFKLLVQWPDRPRFADAVRAFHDNGFPLGEAGDGNMAPIEHMAAAPRATPESLRIFFDLGVVREDPVGWPPSLRAHWTAWNAEETMPKAPAVARPRL